MNLRVLLRLKSYILYKITSDMLFQLLDVQMNFVTTFVTYQYILWRYWRKHIKCFNNQDITFWIHTLCQTEPTIRIRREGEPGIHERFSGKKRNGYVQELRIWFLQLRGDARNRRKSGDCSLQILRSIIYPSNSQRFVPCLI